MYFPTFEISIARVLFLDAASTVPEEVTERFEEETACPS